MRWTLPKGADPRALEPLLERVVQALRSGASPDLKRGRRKHLHRLRGPEESEYLLKRSRYTGLESWLRRLRGGKARRELVAAERLRSRGVPTPIPVAAGEEIRSGRLVADCLLIAPLPEARELGEEWRCAGGTPARRRLLVAAFGALVRRLEEAGLRHRDLAPNNVLVRGEPPQLLPIDFERARVEPALGRGVRRALALGPGPGPRARRRSLTRLARRVGREASAPHRLRFLRAYVGGDPEEVRAWWRALAGELPRQVRRDLAHWRRTATAPGRRFLRLEAAGGGSWSGFVRREPGCDECLESLFAAADRAALRRGPRIAPDPCGLYWAVVYPALSRRARAVLWSRTQVLWDGWRLVPRPVALLARREAAVLILERSAHAVQLSEESTRAAAQRWEGSPQPRRAGNAPGNVHLGPWPPAVRVLVGHLEALGRLRGPLDATVLALLPAPGGPGGGRAVLLDPRVWEPKPRWS